MRTCHGKKHNWVSKLKMNGNERADEEAKKSIKKRKNQKKYSMISM